jgi:ABC-type antimicrobial peptide transport system permease subunit
MLRSYLKIAWRNLRKERLFTLLNLAGLSTGLACALLIWLWVSDERGKDHGNPKDEQLYQVMQNLKEDGQVSTMPYTSGLLAAGLKTDFPQVEYAATVIPASWFGDPGLLSVGDTLLKARGQFVSKDYYALFPTAFVAGAVPTDMNSIAITQKLAREIYGSAQNAVGKSIRWNQGQFDGTYLITGVFEDLPSGNTDPFDVLLKFDFFGKKRPGIVTDWGNSDPSTFIRLKPGTDTARFDAAIAGYVKKKTNEDKTLFIRRFSDRYLYDQYTDGHLTGGRIVYVRLFSLIALFILALACINFMNLSTARASRRLKEVGIKKVVGARRGTLVVQYLGESLLMSVLALGGAITLVAVVLPSFNVLTGKTLVLDWAVMAPAALVTLVTGLVAGSYPALYLSGFKPIATLKGSLRTATAELWVRKGLVVFQFVLSVTAIASVLVIYRQLHYIQSRDLGYSRDHVIDFAVPVSDSLSGRHALAFLNELKSLPGVVSAGSHHHDFNGGHGGIGGFDWPGRKPGQELSFANLEVGTGFMQTMGLRMKEGRYMSDDSSAAREIVFNEAAIKYMGLKHPIGQTVTFWGMHKQIVGVTEDFNFESLYKTIEPAFFQVYPITDNIVIKIRAGSEHQVLEQVDALYGRYYKGLAFDYHFLDEEYAALYASENRVSVLSRYFAGLAILISCLGLFGLAAFTAQRRQKEIGIRKVIGASVARISLMLSRDFFRLVGIATLVAFPLTWWMMNRWLEAFAYRIHIGVDVFLISGGAIMGITLVTIGFQSVKAGRANPVNSLRSE